MKSATVDGLTIFRQLAQVGLFAHLASDELAALDRLARKSTATLLNDFLRVLLTAARDTIVWAPEYGGIHLHPADFQRYIQNDFLPEWIEELKGRYKLKLLGEP